MSYEKDGSSHFHLRELPDNPGIFKKGALYIFDLGLDPDTPRKNDCTYSLTLSESLTSSININQTYNSAFSEQHYANGYSFVPDETAIYSFSIDQERTLARISLYDADVRLLDYTEIVYDTENFNKQYFKKEIQQNLQKGKKYYIRVCANEGFNSLDKIYSYALKIKKLKANIKLSETEVILPINTETTLKATVSSNIANTKITWTTSNKSIATVNNKGTVTAKAPGIATITAKCNGVNAKCKITVTLAVPKLKTAKSAAAGKIKITWAKSAGADGYIVYRKKGSEWIKLKTVGKSTTVFTDTRLTSGKKYAYTVKAYMLTS